MSLAHAQSSADPNKARCAASYEAAQVLRRDERLGAARAELLICQETCPEQLAQDCTRWLDEVGHVTPTARFSVRDADGKLLDGVRVTIDGHPLEGPIDGSAPDAVQVEPGRHVFRFEHAGHVPAEVPAELHVGERDRMIRVTLAPVSKPHAPERPAVVPPAPSSKSRTPSYVVGGIGLAALATAGGLAIKGHVDRADLRSSCAPDCGDADIDAVRNLWWAAAGFAVAGAAAVGVAIVLWPRDHRAPAKATATLSLTPGAVALTIPLH